MGQKVSPVGLRVGVIRGWDSRWYANKNEVADLLHEDLKIREYIKSVYKNAAIAKVEIERFHVENKNRVRITLHTQNLELLLVQTVKLKIKQFQH